MLSDVLYDAEAAIVKEQRGNPGLYALMNKEIDAVRCSIAFLQLKLDNTLPQHLLVQNPIYQDLAAGSVVLHDRFLWEYDDSVLTAFRAYLRTQGY